MSKSEEFSSREAIDFIKERSLDSNCPLLKEYLFKG